jgi:hypothetical protein
MSIKAYDAYMYIKLDKTVPAAAVPEIRKAIAKGISRSANILLTNLGYNPEMTPLVKEEEYTEKGQKRIVLHGAAFLDHQSGYYEVKPVIEIIIPVDSQFATLRTLDLKSGNFVMFNPEEIKKAIPSQSGTHRDDILNALSIAGIPEQVIECNRDLMHFLADCDRNEERSRNMTFHVQDKNGQAWLLKLNPDRERALMDSLASYYLSRHFDFILPSMFPEPVSAAGYHMTFHFTPPKFIGKEPLEYWIDAFAKLHSEGKDVFQRYNLSVPSIVFPAVDMLSDKQGRVSKESGFTLDKDRLEGAVARLSSSPRLSLVMNDVRPQHLIGEHMCDLELMGLGHPGVDLAPLLMVYQVPVEGWAHYAQRYLRSSNSGLSLSAMISGMRDAAYCKAAREIISTSSRILTPSQAMANRRLASYLRDAEQP